MFQIQSLRLNKPLRLEVRRRGQRERAIVGQRQVDATPRRPCLQSSRDIHRGDQPVKRFAPMLREEPQELRQLFLEFLQFGFRQVALDLDQNNALARAVGAADHVELLFGPVSPLADTVRDSVQVKILSQDAVKRRIGQALGETAELVAQPADLLAQQLKPPVGLFELPVGLFVVGHQRGDISSGLCHQVFQFLIGHMNKLSERAERVNSRSVIFITANDGTDSLAESRVYGRGLGGKSNLVTLQ